MRSGRPDLITAAWKKNQIDQSDLTISTIHVLILSIKRNAITLSGGTTFMMRFAIGLFVAVVLTAGCTTRLGDFSIVSVKHANVPAKSIGKRVAGESCVFSWLGIGWFGNEPILKDAFDRAMQEAGPEYDALVDTIVYRNNRLLENCYYVRGVAISTKSSK